MSARFASLEAIPISYASCSIGYKDEHTLPRKLDAIAAAGFTAIELSMPDVLAFASTHLKREVDPKAFDDLVVATQAIKAQCNDRGLSVMMLQPFANFEGWPEGSPERKDAFERARGWIRIMQACGTDLLQVGSSDTPAKKIGKDRSRFVTDLQELADLLQHNGFRLAYENWCWSTHAPDWKDVWDIVQQVDRPNIGLCLDTFQTGGGEWADPTTVSGLVEDCGKEDLEQRFRESLALLSRSIPKEKIYLLQISDAYKPASPFSRDTDDEGLRPRGRWSHDFRPLPFSGGYLPVVDVARAVLETGFRGWFSYEVFDGGPDGKGKEYDLAEYARSASAIHKRLLDECNKA